jgi:RNA polymerase sigma-70 factor (ECF subfamily)
MTLELLFVKGWGNKEAAEKLGISEQQVANIKFQAKKRLHDSLCAAKLSPDVFPELRMQ